MIHPSPIRKRCQRWDIPGHAHYLTFSCFQRRAFLTRDRARHWLLDAVQEARAKHAFDLWAWVFMPEHVHLLIRPRPRDYAIRQILMSLKLPVTRCAIFYLQAHAPAGLQALADPRPHGATAYRFWQRGGGYDRNLWSAKEIWEKIHYIHANPVRRKLVTTPTKWPWSSARDYAGDGPGLLPLDLASLREACF